jgi:hypothetical protein
VVELPGAGTSAILLGLTTATDLQRPIQEGERSGTVATGDSLLSLFAIGCPVCNKLVVFAIGAGGTMRWFAPVQPVLAIVSLAMLAAALWTRLVPRSPAGPCSGPGRRDPVDRPLFATIRPAARCPFCDSSSTTLENPLAPCCIGPPTGAATAGSRWSSSRRAKPPVQHPGKQVKRRMALAGAT